MSNSTEPIAAVLSGLDCSVDPVTPNTQGVVSSVDPVSKAQQAVSHGLTSSTDPQPDYAITPEQSEESECSRAETSQDDDGPYEPVIEEIIWPGLILKDDYVLLRKIGAGNNASVWMCYQITTGKYVATKVQNYKCYADGRREIEIIRKINEHCAKNPTINSHVIHMLDFFVFAETEEVKFVCSVYELYAGSIKLIINSGKHKYGLPIPVVKRMAKQILIALVTMHDSLQVIHTDIKPENILFKGTSTDFDRIIELFVESGFSTKHKQLVAMYASDPEKLAVEIDALAIESVAKVAQLEISIYEGEEFIPGGEEDDDDDFIEGDYDSNEEYDEDDVEEEEEEEGEEGEEGEEREEEENYDNIVFNTRDQSEDDTVVLLDYKEMHDFDADGFYVYDAVLNNRAASTDQSTVIDDKYVNMCDTAVTDFGNSYFYSKRTRDEIQDRRYRAPEVILDFNYGYACDIWSTMCVVFELLTGYPLFEPLDWPLTKDIHHLYLMEKSLGPIPLKLKKATKRCRFLFDKSRGHHVKNLEPFEPAPLRDRLVVQFLFTEEEADGIMSFLSCGLHYAPNRRHTAKKLLTHSWLADA